MRYINRLMIAFVWAGMCHLGWAQEQASYFMHTIVKGQSLYSIASMYGVSRADIIKLNPGSDERIYTGAQLRIPRVSTDIQGKHADTFHTIVKGETLYRVSVQYKVSAADICKANPGLSAENFKAGQVVRIPQSGITGQGHDSSRQDQQSSDSQAPKQDTGVQPRCRDMHKVKRRETIYGISRQYHLTEAELIAANPELKGTDKLKRGSYLCIPYPQDTNVPSHTNERIPTNIELFNESAPKPKDMSTIRAAIVLPFLNVPKSESGRMVEYYEGFLLAVDSLKRTGVSIDLHTYNSGSDAASISTLLNREELKQMDIIFGPLHQQHIKPLAEFARKNDIRMVIPFTSKDNTVYDNPAIYQINTPQSYLYSEVYEHFTRQFKDANVIFINATHGASEKTEFVKGLKEELKRQGIAIRSVNENTTAEEYKAVLKADKPNIFVPTSGSNVTLIKILPQLTLLVREQPETEVHLFGYPEWQTYTKDHLEAFFELDTYFYSSFYTNNLLPSAKQFTNNYRSWYGKEMDDRYPKFGMLGFDTGFYFLKGLSRFGSKFEQEMNRLDITPIQTGFKFDRVNNWGGFINRKVFFVRFTKNFELIKLDFD